jgi:hypothetical protein
MPILTALFYVLIAAALFAGPHYVDITKIHSQVGYVIMCLISGCFAGACLLMALSHGATIRRIDGLWDKIIIPLAIVYAAGVITI